MTLLKRKESIFPSVWNDFFTDDFFKTPSVAQAGTTIPAVNVKETPVSYTIEMSAAGLKKDDFNINLDRNILTISSEVEDKHVEEKENYTRREFSYSSFERSFALPDAASTDDIVAKYEDGILTIEIPKKEEAKQLPKTIEIK
ncbi:Hsp20/alpha crystallin family protein [Lutibacter sp.]